jgi:hypothetical protein
MRVESHAMHCHNISNSMPLSTKGAPQPAIVPPQHSTLIRSSCDWFDTSRQRMQTPMAMAN